MDGVPWTSYARLLAVLDDGHVQRVTIAEKADIAVTSLFARNDGLFGI